MPGAHAGRCRCALHIRKEFNTTFVMYDEDHTLGNTLRMMLNQKPKVRAKALNPKP